MEQVRHPLFLLTLPLATVFSLTCFTVATAQITPDNSLGAESSVVAPNVEIKGIPSDRIDGGAIRGDNLFHSFQQFNINVGRGAYFSNPAGIANILTRVTGGNVSNIQGVLGVLGNANLFLINPNGILFGPNARLDVGGSFLGSTANSLIFKNGFEFSATNPQAPPLLTINVPIGLGFRNNPGNITTQSTTNQDSSYNSSTLEVPEGNSLALVGGNVILDRPDLLAPGGRVELGGLSASGTIGLNGDGSLSFPVGVQRGDISLTNGAGVNVRSGGGGSIAVNARNLEMTGGSFLRAGIGEGLGTVGTQAGNISVNATEAINLNNSFIFNQVLSGANGQGGDLNVSASSLRLEGGAVVDASTYGAGKGGNLRVDAQDVQLIGTSADGQTGSGLAATAQPNSTGDAGDLTIRTNTLLVRDGAQVFTGTFGAGKGGSLNVDAQDVQLIGTSADGQFLSGLFANVQRNSTGNAGDLTIKTNTLLVRDGARVNTSTSAAGKGGNLRVDAQDVQLIGRSADGQTSSGLFANANRNSTGNAGDLTIKTNTLLARDGAQVSASTSAAGKGGSLSLDAQDVQLIGRSADGQASSGLFAQANSTGNAGDLTIKTNTLLVRDGAQVNTSTSAAAKGGNLRVDAQDVQLIGTSADGQFLSGLFANANRNSTGDAGDLTVRTNTLLVRDGAQIFTGTSGAGKGGSLSLDAQDVQLIGRSADGQTGSGLFANANRNSTGDAGDLTIKTNTLLVRDGAQVFTGTFGTGKGGSLSLDAQDVQLIGRSADGQASSGLFANANQNSTGNAGDLTIKTNTLLVRDGAQVSASTFGAGKGGSLSLDAQDVQLIGRSADGQASSGLFAQANSTGNAGDLTIKTNTLLVRDGARVLTSTFGKGKGGNLSVDAQDVQLIGRSADGQFGSGLFADVGSNSTGDAGDLTIKTNTLLVRDGAQVGAGTFGAGKGGSLRVDAQDVQLIGTSADGQFSSGLFASTTPNSTGDAGDLTVRTNTLLVRDGAKVSVESRGTGTAGNMTLNAGSIRLDNNGLLTANTQNAKVNPNREQATININSKDLIMSRNSIIRTNATGENVIGGNININTGVLVGFDNSDITANSTNSRGGNVKINSQGIFGFQSRNPASPNTSDITATGVNNQSSGNVLINVVDIDPTQGLFELTETVVDPAQQIALNPCVKGFGSTFTVTGRGGLPTDPNKILSSDNVRVDLIQPVPSKVSLTSTTQKQPSKKPPVKQIIPAQGWIYNEKGQVVLVGYDPTKTGPQREQPAPNSSCAATK
ncbi:MAG: filamentous hemagglutinin N-terminal domain-containing protein [Brasilonema angustatum HA4187-MV1]|jgi:filamentous hemagglutinin family protein|nr:filamentous hemagglutinin N-terminal domain-containing protein [Brasilonema angustatum HA4187-MV1]